jgi:hypothetical protein
MAVLGIIFLALIGAGVLFGLFLLLTSMTDIRRYRRISRM